MTTSDAFTTIQNLLRAPDSGLTVTEKRTLYYDLGHSLLAADQQDVLDATRRLADAYSAAGITGIAAVRFKTSEYDNGHFFSPHRHALLATDGTPITRPDYDNLAGLDDDDAETLHQDLDDAFTTYAASSLGPTATLYVDLTNDKVDYATS